MARSLRKWLGIIIAILCYYVVHEGAHVLAAISFGVLQEIRLLGLGMQVVIETRNMSNIQLAIFSVVGSVSSLIAAYALVLLKDQILRSNHKFVKAMAYYTTLGLLLIDPIYLSLLCSFFGGGDMNGIVLFGISELVIRLIFGVIGALNVLVIIKYIYPAYKQNFQQKVG